MAKSQTVSNLVKNRLVTGTIIFYGLVIIAIAVILSEYFLTGHYILLVVAGLLVGICAVNLIILVFSLPRLHGLDIMELWITDAAKADIVEPLSYSSPLKKSTEPIFRACNALAARLKVDSSRRVRFVERLVHDMRTSLASILGYADVLADYNTGVESATLQTYGNIIANQATRLGKMIEDAQTASYISENRLSLEFDPVRLATLLASLIDEARKNNVREIAYLDDLGDCLVSGDSFRLREMLSKLIDNALSYSTSSVSIQALVENDQGGSWAKIVAEDHGNGFSETELTALFHPFEPSKDQRTLPIFRSSLSFYIINAIAEGHSGKMIVQSIPGQGTTYTIILPVYKVKE